MSSGYLLCSPLLIINLGGEMMYILEQRLAAQAVFAEKIAKILNESIKTLFSPEFLKQLFEPQKIFSMQYTKKIFHKVVHSSIMTLDEANLNKLFDLMLMGFKYQIIASNFPQAIYHITMNHLDGLLNILKNAPEQKFIHNVKKVFKEKYSTLNANDYLMIRRELLRYLQDKTVRVSVFLQDEIQNIDGRMIIDNSGYGGIGTELPGKVRYYNSSGDIIKTNHFDLKSGESFIENKSTTFTEPIKITLGTNLYAIERPKLDKSKQKDKGKSTEQKKPKPQINKEADRTQKLDLNPEAAKRELNMLAALIKGSEKEESKENLNLNLFPEPIQKSGEKGVQDDYAADVIFFETTQSQQQERVKNLLKDFDDDDRKGSSQKKAPQDDGDDLLDLMDSAT